MSSTDVQNEELEKYELMVILMADLSQDDTEKELKKIKKLIKDSTGEIYHEDVWDVRDLAYVIKKQDKGYYVIYYFTLSDTKHMPEMERELRINKMVIRHLFVKSPKNYEIKKLSDFELSENDRRTHRVDKDAKPEKVERTAKTAAPKKEVEKETPKPEPKVEKVEKVEKKAMDISDLDSQLESLLDDPDINIKL